MVSTPNEQELNVDALSSLPAAAREKIASALTPRLTPWIPHRPTPKQAAFLLQDDTREGFYGGAAGGGKSDALLMAALQYADVPGYAALILRRNFKQLALPGALMSRSHEWLDGTAARWRAGEKTWYFPCPGGGHSTLTFGYFGTNEEARRQYESAEFQYIGIDELTAFEEDDYRFMFSRARRRAGMPVTVRVRAASNPIGRGRGWVKKRFVDPATRISRAFFVPAYLWDNPYLDQVEYIETLRELHPIMWQRLLRGDWDAVDPGEVFQPRLWLDEDDYLEEVPVAGVAQRARYWDLAASETTSSNPDPDWTAGARFARLTSGLYVLEHVVRFRHSPARVERAVAGTALGDPGGTVQWIEQDPGQAGKSQVEHYQREVAPDGIVMRGNPVRGSKALRARPLAAAMGMHRVKIVRGRWLDELFDEMESFSEDVHHSGAHDDQVDACSGGFEKVRVRAPSGSTADLARERAVRRA